MRLLFLFQIFFFYSIIRDYHTELEGVYEKSIFLILKICMGLFTYFTLLLIID